MSKMSLFKKNAGYLALIVIPAILAGCNPVLIDVPANREELFARAVLIRGGVYEIGSREPGCYPVASVEVAAFYIWPTEVTKSWWNVYKGGPAVAGPDGALPAADLAFDDALAFCAWVSDQYKVRARLPTIKEWLVAAQAGTPGMPYSWGWAKPDSRAAYNAMGTAAVGSFEPNAWGLFDMCGNVAEWAESDDPILKPVMGGSWAERQPDFVRISNEMKLPRMYQGKDVGFRFVIEP